MRSIFISDAHLKGTGDISHTKLIRFFDLLRGRGDDGTGSTSEDAYVVDMLVIAGDFFDFWFARGDVVYPGFQPVIEKIAELKRKGIRICLFEGNHDFFLGDYFTSTLGIEVFPEWAELTIDGLRVLISHGDTVDRGNRKYLALRRLLRSGFARTLQRKLPLDLLWRLARRSSDISKEQSEESRDRLAEVMHRFALGKFREGYDAVILGHCHKPMLREAVYLERSRIFATLGDWAADGAYLSCLDGRFSMERFPR